MNWSGQQEKCTSQVCFSFGLRRAFLAISFSALVSRRCRSSLGTSPCPADSSPEQMVALDHPLAGMAQAPSACAWRRRFGASMADVSNPLRRMSARVTGHSSGSLCLFRLSGSLPTKLSLRSILPMYLSFTKLELTCQLHLSIASGRSILVPRRDVLVAGRTSGCPSAI